MAVFDPAVQAGNDEMPNFFRYSEPVRQPRSTEANTGTGIALKTAATAVGGIAELTEQTAKDIINEDVRNKIEPIRQDFTQSLQSATNQNIIPAPAQTSSGSKTLTMDTSTQPPPDAVDNGLGKVDALQSAMKNGKINSTYYHMQLNSAVTDLRSKYPGFVDYIDQRVAGITGGNPANQLVQDLMQDYNSAISSKKTEADKILDLARGAMTKGFDGAQNQYQRLQADPSYANDFLNWYTEENARFTRLELREKQRQDYKGSKEFITQQRKEDFTNFTADTVDSNLHSMLKLSGTDKPQTIYDILQTANNNPNAYNEQQMEEFASKLQTHRQLLKAQLITLSNNKGYTTDIGEESRDKIIESQLGVYDAMYDAVRKDGAGGAGLAFYHAHQVRAIFDQTKYNITNSDIGSYLNNTKIVTDALGPGASGVIMPMLLKGQVGPDGKVSGGITDKLRPLFTQNKMEALAQPNGPNNPTSITDHMESTARLVKDKKISPVEQQYLNKSYIDVVNDLKDPKVLNTELGPHIVQYLFNPKSNTFLQNFKMDYTTVSPEGRMKVEHPGKYAAWTQMTDPDITKNISKLDETSKNMYRNWVDITGRELIGEDVKNLNHFTGHDNLYFSWDSNTKQLALRNKEGALTPVPVGQEPKPRPGPPLLYPIIPDPQNRGFNIPPSDSYVWQVQKVVDRINRALPNLDRVYSSLGGGDTETMLLQTLQQYGMDFNGKVSGLPKAFGDAIAASRKPAFKDRFKGEEK